jgi:hypothetical protein
MRTVLELPQESCAAQSNISRTGAAWQAAAALSRQSEKFLIGQSRKFRLTAKGWKDGTNRDEPRGTGQVGVVMGREEAQCADHQHVSGRRHLLFFGQEQLILTNVFGTELIGWFAEVLGKLLDGRCAAIGEAGDLRTGYFPAPVRASPSP